MAHPPGIVSYSFGNDAQLISLMLKMSHARDHHSKIMLFAIVN